MHEIETNEDGKRVRLENINLKIFPGEIVGIAGVSGNGQKEICDVVLGIDPSFSGKKLVDGNDVTNQSVGVLRKNGISFVPENPLTMASVPYMTVLENFSLTRTWEYARNGGLTMDWQAAKADLGRTAKRLGFTVNYYAIARSLSGGHLQRTVILREMSHNPRLIIASYLTRGLDVRSALAARQALLQAREKGAGVLLISEDLDELLVLSDRLLVLFAGKIVGEFKPTETDLYTLGHLMTGSIGKHA